MRNWGSACLNTMGLGRPWRREWNLGQGFQQGVTEHRRPEWLAKPLGMNWGRDEGPTEAWGCRVLLPPMSVALGVATTILQGRCFLSLGPESLSLAPSCIQELPGSRALSRCSVNTGGTNGLAGEGANERYSWGDKLAGKDGCFPPWPSSSLSLARL